MKMGSEFWDRAWQRRRQGSSLYRCGFNQGAWTEFWNQFAPTYHKILQALLPLNQDLVRSWIELGLVDADTGVLDIGCGPGTYSLPLAGAAGKITALDTSEKMLDVLQKEAEKRQLQNIELKLADWQDLSCHKEYDLVVAANCPAISNRKNLLKMSQAARKFALFICYAGQTGSPIRHTLWKNIMGEEMQGSGFDVSYPFNILYQDGFYPQLRFVKQEYRYREKAETVLQNYCVYFKVFGKEGQSLQRKLAKCLAEFESGGFIEETMAYRLALLWWETTP